MGDGVTPCCGVQKEVSTASWAAHDVTPHGLRPRPSDGATVRCAYGLLQLDPVALTEAISESRGLRSCTLLTRASSQVKTCSTEGWVIHVGASSAGHHLTGFRRGGRENRSAPTRQSRCLWTVSWLADRLEHGSPRPAVALGDTLGSPEQPE